MIFRSVDVEKRVELDEESPPRPLADTHEFADILLDATDRNVLGLEGGKRRKNKV